MELAALLRSCSLKRPGVRPASWVSVCPSCCPGCCLGQHFKNCCSPTPEGALHTRGSPPHRKAAPFQWRRLEHREGLQRWLHHPSGLDVGGPGATSHRDRRRAWGVCSAPVCHRKREQPCRPESGSEPRVCHRSHGRAQHRNYEAWIIQMKAPMETKVLLLLFIPTVLNEIAVWKWGYFGVLNSCNLPFK